MQIEPSFKSPAISLVLCSDFLSAACYQNYFFCNLPSTEAYFCNIYPIAAVNLIIFFWYLLDAWIHRTTKRTPGAIFFPENIFLSLSYDVASGMQ